MIDGVMVMDARGRVVDINRAAHRMLCITGSSPVGKPAADVLADCPEMLAFTATGAAQGTSQITRGEPPQVLDIRVTVLPSHSRQPTGYLVVIRDVTERMRAEAEIRAANQHLRVQLAEIERLQHELREQATHDSLTGLFNRRFFEETLQRELAQAERERHPFALILLDIDFFKSINDAFGHTAGDLMLQAVGQLLQKQTRGGDVACRFGGEEFAIVMPGATAEQAATRANDWRGLVCALLVPFAGQALRATISAGVAEYPTHGTTRDQLLHAADQALYLSKHGGRDMVTISSTGSPIGQCRTPPVPAQTRGTATTV
jgi:diguanylate cyclase (GGDEF)-like protein/PAS domain S-box-containing protein